MTDDLDAQNAHNPRNPAGHLAGHRWKKGQSGNPGGRPKGRSMTAALRELARSEHNGKRLSALLAGRLMKEALGGMFPFLKEAVDRLEGPVPRPGEAAEAAPKPPIRFVEVVLESGFQQPTEEMLAGAALRARADPDGGRETARALPPDPAP